MKAGDIDVFLGNWMPAHTEFRADLDAAKAVEVLNHNLAGAKFTLAVPSYVGITDFAELDPNAERSARRSTASTRAPPATPFSRG